MPASRHVGPQARKHAGVCHRTRLGLLLLSTTLLLGNAAAALAEPPDLPPGLPPASEALPALGWTAFKVVLMLLALVALLLGASTWLSGRLRGRTLARGTAEIRIAGCRRLEPRKTLYLVECLGQRVLVGASEAGLQTLLHEGCVRDAAAPPASLPHSE